MVRAQVASEQIGGGDRAGGKRAAAQAGGGDQRPRVGVGASAGVCGAAGRPRAGRRAGGLQGDSTALKTSEFIFIRVKAILLHPKRKDGVL